MIRENLQQLWLKTSCWLLHCEFMEEQRETNYEHFVHNNKKKKTKEIFEKVTCTCIPYVTDAETGAKIAE